MISRARNTRSYMPTRYKDGAARSHGFGTSNRTCLDGIRTSMHTRYQFGDAGFHGFGTPDRIFLRGIIGWGCRISRVGNSRSKMPTGYQDGTAGSHG